MKKNLFLAFLVVLVLGGPVLLGSSAPAAAAEWVAPVGDPRRPTVLAGFDPPAQPWLAGHRGVDLAAGPGQVVVAAGSGVVAYAGLLAGRPVLTISHGELRTTYEPVVSELPVGSSVVVGQVVGTVGIGGHCSYSCVHWGLLRGEEYLNPLLLLGLLPPVLKPLGEFRPAAGLAERRVADEGVKPRGLGRLARQEAASSEGGAASGSIAVTTGMGAGLAAAAATAAVVTRRRRKAGR